MIVEHCQLLSTAHHVLDGDFVDVGIYRKTHVNHPSAVWVRETSSNYVFMHQVTQCMCDLFKQRTGRVHASERVLKILSSLPVGIKQGDMTPFATAMPDEYKAIEHTHDVYTAYQWYLNDKLNEWLWYNKLNEWLWYNEHYMEGVPTRRVEWHDDEPDWFVRGHWYIKANKPFQTVEWDYG
jgi:hypothetical protein